MSEQRAALLVFVILNVDGTTAASIVIFRDPQCMLSIERDAIVAPQGGSAKRERASDPIPPNDAGAICLAALSEWQKSCYPQAPRALDLAALPDRADESVVRLVCVWLASRRGTEIGTRRDWRPRFVNIALQGVGKAAEALTLETVQLLCTTQDSTWPFSLTSTS
jgi:hypothetical protein